MNKNSRLVYSTDRGRIKTATDPAKTPPPATDGVIRVGRETKGRNGKSVTVISGFNLPPDALKSLAKQLKQLCGTGGTARDGKIEIQGEQRDAIVAHLEKQGFTVKRAGG